jgi:UDP-2,3-diacylglucosamine pyrophosphatase LpxH
MSDQIFIGQPSTPGATEEREHLPLPESPAQILVVSDLHIAAGRDARTGKFNRRENFFADDAFGRFLRYYDPKSIDGDSLLVLNGDTFDFLRVVRHPKTSADFQLWSDELAALGENRDPEELEFDINDKERRFGLRTHDYKTIWKLMQIAGGHRLFFDALGWWVAQGGHLLFVKGNHDLELYWSLVQKAIRQEVGRNHPNAQVDRQVLFRDVCGWLSNVYLEHGHRFESVTAVKGGGPTLPNGREIRLPLGSFINRYVINKLEDLEPFLDNIKPVNDLLWALFRRQPLKSLEILFRAMPFLRRAFRPYFFKDSLGFAVFFISLLVPLLTAILILLVLFVPPVRDWVVSTIQSQTLRRILSVVGLAAPWLIGLLRDLFPKKKPRFGEDHYGQAIHEILMSANPNSGQIYGVLGHTHAMDVQYLGTIQGAEAVYLNSGSWAPTWREERPDLAGKTIYSFVRFELERGEYAHRCMEWSDERGEPVQATILARKATS